jgi:type IV pilus assembly protein PilA
MNMKNMKQARQQGFTLIELMIVIAIVGILSAVALPAYQDYTVRAKLSEVLAAAGSAKTSYSEYFSATGTKPTSASLAGISTNSQLIASVSASATGFVFTMAAADATGAINDSDIAGKTFTFTATYNDDDTAILSWACSTNVASTAYSKLPSNCRSAG